MAWRAAVSGMDDVGDVYEVVNATNAGFSALPDVASGSAGAVIISGTGTAALSVTSGLVTLAAVTHTGAVVPTVTAVTNEAAKYMHGAVWIDTVNGAAGTTSYTNGIATNPSSSIASAKTIADNLKLKRFWIQSGSSITMAAAYVGYVFTGAGYVLALGGQDISKAIIENVEGLSGTGICTTGEAVIRNCHLNAITIGEVDFNDCHLMGTVTMSQATVPYLFNQCTGVSAAKITFAAANQSAVISKWSGALTIAGMVSTNTLYLDGDGDVTFDNTSNAGVVYISGNIRLTNNGVSMNITDTSRWDENQNVYGVVGGTIAVSTIAASSTTTLTGAVSLGSTLGVTGTATLAALTVTGATTHTGATVHTGHVSYADGVAIAAPSTAGRHGLAITGNAAGAGMILTGGNAAPGLYVTASGESAAKFDGTGSDNAGLEITATGAGSYGLRAAGASAGIYAAGGAAGGIGLNAVGNTSGAGLVVTGGNDAHGATVTAGGGNSDGLRVAGTGSGHGLSAAGAGGGTGHGILATSGSGATGDGLRAVSAATAGNGMYLAGNGANGDGLEAVAGAGVPIRGNITGTVSGIAGTTQTFDALQTALDSSHGATSWATATGFATPTNITAAAGIAVTSIGNNVITAASINAAALNGKGDWNIGKTGYALTQTFPANFADLAIAVTTGIVDANVQKINDITITGDGQTGTEFGV